MDLHDLNDVLTAAGPFVTVHVESESAVEQAAAKYDMTWKDVVRQLRGPGRRRDARAPPLYEARGEHSEGASRLVVATTADATVRLAVPLGSSPARPVVDVSPLPHLLPLIDDVTTRVPHVVVLADHTGADVSAYYDTEHVATEVTVKGHAPDIRKVPVGGWSHLHYQHRAENGWDANAREVVDAVVELAQQVGARLIVAAGEERQLVHVAEHLPTHLKDAYVAVPGGRGQDGSDSLVRRRVADAVSPARRDPYAGAARGLRAGAWPAQARGRRPRRRRRGPAQGAGRDAARHHRRPRLLHPVLRPRADPARDLGTRTCPRSGSTTPRKVP